MLEKLHLHIKLRRAFCQMPVKHLQNLAQQFLSNNNNLNYFSKKKFSEKIRKFTLFCFLSSFSVVALWLKFSHAYPEKNV